MDTKTIRIQHNGNTIGEITVENVSTNSEVIRQWFRENPNSTGPLKRAVFGKNVINFVF